ncbi:MAG TPA: prolyl oligopeptidase family serine peptidase [Blastocatellia bacterium]|nr:prolyl oligopeptidase family serine peptidase [Blastocatellia bacterium]
MILRTMRRFVYSITVLIACAVIVVAQDAGQVLRVSVGYNTLKNTVQMTAEKRAEVDKLGKLATEANAAGKYGDALKHLYHAMALMRGTEWTPARALSSALTVKLDHAMLEPGQAVDVRLGQIYSLDEKLEGKLAGSVTLMKMSGEERVAELKTLDAVEPDFIARSFTASIVVPEVESGNYRVMLKLQSAKGEPVTKTAVVHIERGLAAQAAGAKSYASKIEAKLKSKHQDALAYALASAQYRIALYDLANNGEIGFDRIDFQNEFKEALSILTALDKGSDPFAARRGDFRKAYLSKVDNTLQPFRVFVPSSYDGTKPYPLVIALHGMGGDENSYFDAYGKGAFTSEAEKHGYIVACPKGRKPASMYTGDAERDVMDVLADMMRAYRIDPDRVYMTGHSMGGFGTWSVAMNHPEVFAAIAPVSGGVMNPAALSKIAHIPELIIHGDDDKTVSVERSRVVVAAGKKLNIEMKYIEVPKGTHGDVVAPHFKDVFDWFDAHKRKVEAKAAAGSAKNN